MSDTIQNMLESAQAAKSNAYSPSSNFKVGACIRTEDDQFFSGCNIENASYGMTLCAEASAIANMRNAGPHKIKEILVIGSSEVICAPCGACRQLICEFAMPDTLIHMCNQKGTLKTSSLGELLPNSFGPETFLPTHPHRHNS